MGSDAVCKLCCVLCAWGKGMERNRFVCRFGIVFSAILLTFQATTAVASSPPAPIWSGVYAGIHGGYASGDISYVFATPDGPFAGPEKFDHNLNDWFGGAHLGVQRQFRNFVLGLEVAYSDLHLTDTAESNVKGFKGYFRQIDIDSLFVIGPRLGYATDRWMAYVKGGYASADVETRVFKDGGSTSSITGGRENGWMIGGGLELICWRGFVLGLDYTYVRLDLDDRSGQLPDKKPFTYTDMDDDIHTISLRLSYLFGSREESLKDPLK